ncbi:hypothetical protein KY290_017468 [Solanum tuberosum]|uniref:RNase H type-1 domain-containing protein n=1 Tax=Solanum tuberosum TaxID=4113 RepID=A0ABQ7VE98_SOLTU|nr:hypothetical protein KY290_017468 [Solanum tuberosum]
MAFANPTQFYTNNFSEAHVALIGISWCCNNHIQNIEMELDSMIIVNMIKGNAKPSCRLHSMIDDIRQKMHQRNVKISNCFRERCP